VPAQRPPDDVVEQRQVLGDQLVAGPVIASLRPDNEPGVIRSRASHVRHLHDPPPGKMAYLTAIFWPPR